MRYLTVLLMVMGLSLLGACVKAPEVEAFRDSGESLMLFTRLAVDGKIVHNSLYQTDQGYEDRPLRNLEEKLEIGCAISEFLRSSVDRSKGYTTLHNTRKASSVRLSALRFTDFALLVDLVDGVPSVSFFSDNTSQPQYLLDLQAFLEDQYPGFSNIEFLTHSGIYSSTGFDHFTDIRRVEDGTLLCETLYTAS